MGKTASAFFIFVFFGSILFFLHYGLYHLLSKQGRLNINTVEVEGNNLLSGKAVVEAAMLPAGAGIFDFNLSEIGENIKKNYLVEDAVVMRYPPDRILIRVSERVPVAVIVDKSRTGFLCDRKGLILEKNRTRGLTEIFLDYTVPEGPYISDEVVKMLLFNLSRFERKNEIESINVNKKDGISMIAAGMESTVFYAGKSIPDRDLFNKMLGIASRIKAKGLSIKYIDINKDSAIGYE